MEYLEKDDRYLRLKNIVGKNTNVVREVYRRDDIPCQSPLCERECKCEEGVGLLPKGVTHYVIPDCQVTREYLEILEQPQITGIIILQTVANSVQHEGGKRTHTRLKNMIRDRRKGCILFHNEFHKSTYVSREPGEKNFDWQIRSIYRAAEWFYEHLDRKIPVVLVTQNPEVVENLGDKLINLFVLPLKDYLEKLWKDLIPNVVEQYFSIQTILENKTSDRDYLGYLPQDVINAGIQTGRYVQGHLNVNKNNAQGEAFVKNRRFGEKCDDGSDILVHGMSHRNRAIHGDIVVVELLPKSQWRGRSNVIKETQADEDNAGKDDGSEDMNSNVMPTGQVVAIVRRNWREYAATFAQEEETGLKGGKVLVIPWDFRIPKIRISTRQVEALKDCRIVVRIDSWEIDSQYPNGHFVRSLGKQGDLETEVSTILLENDIHMGPFSAALKEELPVDTWDRPWKIEDEELAVRRDLRQSHLIFSIDPKGCEDVDDTLSVKYLPNGNLELGVHIADVTHFVNPNTFTDQEARSRSTSVYLADRRYDMLPEILSANLCSLVSQVDRYAVSVMWELDKSFTPVNVWYGKTVIRSSYKLFYEIAQCIHDGASHSFLVDNIPELQNLEEKECKQKLEELKEAVISLMKVARHLKANREKGGALQLESVEVQVELSETKSVQDLTPKESLEIHETIAECMIFANHWVAKKIATSFPQKALLRHHPLPKKDQFENLKNCAESCGFHIDTESNKQLAESLDKCVNPNDPVVNKLLRSLGTQAMSNAAYFSTGSVPVDQYFHYGLALDLYTHFTSPIRRYADILVHRQLMAAVGHAGYHNECIPGNQELSEISEHINNKHRAAQYAQRESQELFQCLFFKEKQEDDEFCVVDAVVFQLRANGVYVFIPRFGMKGPLYLKSKDGQVLHVEKYGEPEWTGGSIVKDDHSLTVNSLFGSQTYRLMDHITVRIKLQNSWAHSSSTRLELVSNKPHKTQSLHLDAQHNKSLMIQEVTIMADKDRLQISSHSLGEKFEEHKAKYGQSSNASSLYNMFQSLKKSSLFMNK